MIRIISGLLLVFSIAGCERSPLNSVFNDNSDPETFTISFVKEAVQRYDTEGIESTLAFYNDPASVQGEWYVFIADMDNTVLAQPYRPELIGTDGTQATAPDGSPIGLDFSAATEEGDWFEYMWHDKKTGENKLKRSWVILYNGYIFGSGYFK